MLYAITLTDFQWEIIISVHSDKRQCKYLCASMGMRFSMSSRLAVSGRCSQESSLRGKQSTTITDNDATMDSLKKSTQITGANVHDKRGLPVLLEQVWGVLIGRKWSTLMEDTSVVRWDVGTPTDGLSP